MRSRVRRHLGSLVGPEGAGSRLEARTLKSMLAGGLRGRDVPLPPEFSYRDYAVLLLHVGAGIEHALMLEYLYAAYSLGGPQVPREHQERVRGWQEIILGIAKEEMGHLISVQNVLRLIGGPLSLDREDFPWDSEFYPFPFKLEPFSREALAKYVYAESPSPEDWPPGTGQEREEIERIAQQSSGGARLHRVGELYDVLIALLSDREAIRDSDLRGETYPFQASWDEWGRGYRGGARGNTTGASVAGTPDVIVRPLSSRDDALAALQAVARQGEAPRPTLDTPDLSHFRRFLKIYRELEHTRGFNPARPVATDPYAPMDLNGDGAQDERPGGTPITHPTSRSWAHLLNLRYRMLLTWLGHSFQLAHGLADSDQVSARGLLIHSTFGEMYNLRSLSTLLVQMPLDRSGSERRAGPPFQMPYTVDLPLDELDVWRLHLDLLEASSRLVHGLLRHEPSPEQRGYLLALQDADQRTRQQVQTLLHSRRHARR